MFRWIDERPDVIGPIIQEYVLEFQRRESEKAELAVMEALSGHDRYLVQWYLDGKLHVTRWELRDLLHYDYETIYVGPKFSHVNRTLKVKEKDNG